MATAPSGETPPTFKSVPPPTISAGRATIAFRVVDVKLQALQFKQQLTEMCSSLDLATINVDASDLRAKTEEEEMQELEKQLREAQQVEQSGGEADAQEVEEEISADDTEMADAEEAAADSQGEPSGEGVHDDDVRSPTGLASSAALTTVEKAAAQEAFDKLAQQVKLARKERRDAAATRLVSLREAETSTAAEGSQTNSAPYEQRTRQLKRLQEAISVPLQGKEL